MSLVFPTKLIRNQIAHRIAYREAKERLHELERPEASSAEVDLVALLKQICKEKKIKKDTWLRGNHIDRSEFYVCKRAGWQPVEDEVGIETAEKIKAAILRDAVEFGLISSVPVTTEIWLCTPSRR